MANRPLFSTFGRLEKIIKNAIFALQKQTNGVKQTARKILTIIGLLLFSCYYAGTTFFVHTHSIDGEQIVHSHFSFGGDGTSHTHSKAEIQLIATLSSFAMVLVAAFALREVDRKLLGTIITPILTRKSTSAHRHTSLRAPPVVVLAD